jgi:hypothetical protein
MEVNKLLGKLKPFENKTVLVSNYQDSADIIKEIIKAHAKYAAEYDKISPYFWKGSTKSTAKYIFDYLKKNVDYDIEPDTKQTVKSPAAIIAQGYGDCKHYSLFIAGILDSLRRSGKPIKWAYRFANYKLFARTPHHVFVVADPKTKNEIWIDPVLEFFNNQKAYVNAIDKNYKQMALYSISGVVGQVSNRQLLKLRILRLIRKYRKKGYNTPGHRFFKNYLNLMHRYKILRKEQMISGGFNKDLKLTSVAGFGCCDGVGYTAAERRKDLNRLWHKMQNYKRKGWADPANPYYSEFFATRKAYLEVRAAQTMNGAEIFTATTSIEGIGRRSREERKARRRARREARRSGPNCKGRTGPKIALTLARRAYLLLLRLNFKKMGVKTYLALQNPETANKMYKKWCGLGGKASLLRRTAEKAYLKAKRKGKVSGDYDTDGMIGLAPIAVLWAQAQPVIAAISPLLALASQFLPKDSKAAEIVNTASEASNAVSGNFF